MILAVCFQRSAFRAHFSPREIVCLPTAMTFARKIRRYRFRCIVLACKPAWRYGFTYGSGGTPILVSRAASEQLSLILIRVRRGGATLPDSRRGRHGGATLPDSHQGATRRATLPDSHQGTTRRSDSAGSSSGTTRGFARFSWGGMREATGAPFTTVGIGMRCFPFSF